MSLVSFKSRADAYLAHIHTHLALHLIQRKPLSLVLQYLTSSSTKQERFLESLVSSPVYDILRPVQIQGILYMFNRDVRTLLADVMGLGKSLQVLIIIACMIQFIPDFTALLLAPPSLLDNWIQEARHFIGLERFVKIENANIDWRVPGTQLYLASANNTSAIRDQVIAERFTLLIFDECHMLRNPNAIVTQDTKCIAESMRHRILISGSPAVKVIQLYPILNIIAPERFRNYFEFGNMFCRIFVNTPSGRVAKYDSNTCYNKDELGKQLGEVMLRRYLDYGGNAGDPPGQVRFLVHVPLPDVFAKALVDIEKRYDQTMQKVKELTAKMRKENHDKRKLLQPDGADAPTIRIFNEAFPELNDIVVPIQFAKSIGAVTQQTLHDVGVSSAMQHNTTLPKTPTTELQQKHATKQALLMKMSAECAKVKSMIVPFVMESFLKLYPKGTKIVHFTHYKCLQEKLRTYLQWKNRGTYVVVTGAVPKKQRQPRVNTFQRDDKCTDAILSPIAAGRGLTLTKAHVVIMWDTDWNFDTNLQAEARVNRLTQTRMVHIYYIVLNAISEMLRIQFVQEKAENMAQIVDYVRWHERVRMLDQMVVDDPDDVVVAQRDGMFAPHVLRKMMRVQKKDLGVRFEDVKMSLELTNEHDLNVALEGLSLAHSPDTVDEASDMQVDEVCEVPTTDSATPLKTPRKRKGC